MMTADKLQELQRIAQGEPPMLKVALDGLGDKAAIRKALQVELEKSLRGKESLSDLMGRISKVTKANAARAARIAQTEKTRAVNGSRVGRALEEYLEAYEKAKAQHRKRPELPVFQWVHTNLAKEPRHSHIALSGETRPAGEDFLPGLKYPGDPDAPASETINCHCYVRRVRRD